MIIALDKSLQSPDHRPQIGEDVFLADTATVVGNVKIGRRSSIWFGVILRGDVSSIRIGENCNIQDGTIIHGMYKKWNVTVDDNASIGHGVILHGCHIGAGSLIGMGSLVMDGAKVGKGCLVGAGSLLTEGTDIPDGWLALGRPAKAIRILNDSEKELIAKTTEKYFMYADWYKKKEIL